MNYSIVYSQEELKLMFNSYGGGSQHENIHAAGIALYGFCGDAHDLICKNHTIGAGREMKDPRETKQEVLFRLAEDALAQMERLGWVTRDEKYSGLWHPTVALPGRTS